MVKIKKSHKLNSNMKKNINSKNNKLIQEPSHFELECG